MKGNSKVRLVAVVGATALTALGVTSSGFAKAAKPPKPKCQSTLVALGERVAEGSGFQLYTWTACGRRVGTPFG